MVATARWHLYFNGDRKGPPSHICDLHRALGLSEGCPDGEHLDGNCDHVQMFTCACADYIPCEACAHEEAVTTLSR